MPPLGVAALPPTGERLIPPTYFSEMIPPLVLYTRSTLLSPPPTTMSTLPSPVTSPTAAEDHISATEKVSNGSPGVASGITENGAPISVSAVATACAGPDDTKPTAKGAARPSMVAVATQRRHFEVRTGGAPIG